MKRHFSSSSELHETVNEEAEHATAAESCTDLQDEETFANHRPSVIPRERLLFAAGSSYANLHEMRVQYTSASRKEKDQHRLSSSCRSSDECTGDEELER